MKSMDKQRKRTEKLKRIAKNVLAVLLVTVLLPITALPAYGAPGDELEEGQVGIILDEQGPDVVRNGSFVTVTTRPDTHNGTYLYANFDNSNRQSLTYTFSVPEHGLYDFYVRKPSATAWVGGSVPYTIEHENGQSIVNNIKSANGTTDWVRLGEDYPLGSNKSYTIIAGGSGYDTFPFPSGEIGVAYDAIKLIKTEDLILSDQQLVEVEAAKYETTAFVASSATIGQSVQEQIFRLKAGQAVDSSVQMSVYAPQDGTYLAIDSGNFVLKALNRTSASKIETATMAFSKGAAVVYHDIVVEIETQVRDGDELEEGQVGIILDEQGPDVVRKGSFVTVTTRPDTHNGTYLYANFDNSNRQSLTYTFSVPEHGLYDFYVRKPSATAWVGGSVPYTIEHENGQSIINNIKSANGTTDWVRLGEDYPLWSSKSYTIIAGGSGYDTFPFPSEETGAAYDAIKLIKTEDLILSDQQLVEVEAAKYETTAFVSSSATIGQSLQEQIFRLKAGQAADSSVQMSVYAPQDGTYLAIDSGNFVLKALNETGTTRIEAATMAFSKGAAVVYHEIVVAIETQGGNGSAYFGDQDEFYNDFVSGIFNGAEGTVEMTVRIDQPLEEFGNTYDWLFSMVSGQSGPGNTLMGVYFPPSEERPTGSSYNQSLRFMVRNGVKTGQEFENVTAVAAPTKLNYTVGQPFNLAFVWKMGAGGALTIYMDGVEIARRETDIASVQEKYMPFEFSVVRGRPFNVSNLKISTRALTASELERSTDEFDWGGDTALLADITRGQPVRSNKFATTWHETSQYSVVKPVFRSERQVYYPDENVVFPVATVNYGPVDKTYTVSIEATDPYGAPAFTVQHSIEVPADDLYRVEELALPQIGNEVGLWFLTTTVSDGAHSIVYESVISKVARNDETVDDGPYVDYYGQHIPGDYSMEPWKKIGTSITRGWGNIYAQVFLWNRVEPVNDQFVWEKSDDYVAKALEADMDVLAVLGYTPAWASTRPPVSEIPEEGYRSRLQYLSERYVPQDIQFTDGVPGSGEDWSDYVYQVMKRYAGQVKYFEIGNEFNFHPPGLAASFSGTTEEYVYMLRLAYEAAQQVKSEYFAEHGEELELYVTTSGFSANPVADLQMVEDVLDQASDYFDIFIIHGYEGLGGLTNILSKVRALKANKPELEFWQGEYYPLNSPDRESQMNELIQNYVAFLAAGANRYLNMGIPSEDMFAVRATQSPTKVFQTVATLQNHIRKVDEYMGSYAASPGGFPGSELLNVSHYMKRTDDQYVSVLAANGLELEITIGNPESVKSITDAYGIPVDMTTSDGEGLLIQKNALIIVSTEPLAIASVYSPAPISLLGNPGFESVSGDPAAWPEGVIAASWGMGWQRGQYGIHAYVSKQPAYEGAYAMEFNSNGAPDNRTFVAQKVTLPVPGRYELSGYFKKVSGDSNVQPELNIWGGEVDHQAAPVTLTNQYERYSTTFESTEPDQVIYVNVGILSGNGIVLADALELQLISDSALEEAISEAETLWLQAVAGSGVGQYPAGAKALLAAAIAAAKAVQEDGNATLNEIVVATNVLNQAIADFLASQITSGDDPGSNSIYPEAGGALEDSENKEASDSVIVIEESAMPGSDDDDNAGKQSAFQSEKNADEAVFKLVGELAAKAAKNGQQVRVRAGNAFYTLS